MKKITFAALAVPLMWVLLLLLLFSNYKVYAQEPMVLSGIVKSADGTPLEGVTVWQNDSNNGTQTNEQGFYTLSSTPNATITFEYLGFKTQHLKASTNVLNVTMQTDDDTLEELVINAGYYTVTDKERTGSISKITSKEIGQQPVANPLAAMQGRMAGVNITQSSGTPGGGFDIQIRGRNSLRTEGNAPLYIVDGVPYPSQSVSDANISAMVFSSGNISPLNSINPNDIESIEVLKDADATAIYGSRGANGVVLITTKKGNTNKTTFNFQSTTSVSTVAKYMDLMNTEQYLKMRGDAFANDGITKFPENAYDVNGTWDPNRYTDWQKKFIGGKAVSQNTQFSVSGGSDKTNYLFSVNHRKDGVVFPGDFSYKRTNFMLNLNHTSEDERFKIFFNIIKSDQRNHLMAGDFTTDIYLAPNAPDIYDSKGHLNWENNTFENPFSKLNAVYLSKLNNYTGNISLNYDLSKKLVFTLRSGFTNAAVDEVRTTPSTLYNPVYQMTSEYSIANFSNSETSAWIAEPMLNWDFGSQKMKMNFILGSTVENRNYKGKSIEGFGFTSNDFIFNLANATYKTFNADTESEYKYLAAFSRLNINILNTYVLNMTARRDGSSRFGHNNRFANFGAIGIAWILSNNSFLKNSSWVDFAKLRMSYGISGNDLIGDYQYYNRFGISSQSYDGIQGLDPLRLYNPDFSWEKNKKFEIGIETEIFNKKLAPSISYYRNVATNQLVGVPLPATTGFSSIQSNLEASVLNSGIEAGLKFLLINTSSLNWNVSVNQTWLQNKLLKFPNIENSTYKNTYEIGYPITIRKFYQYEGIDKETGLYTFKDINNDGILNIEDKIVNIDLGIKSYGGLQSSFSYKKWSFDFNIIWVKRNVYKPEFYNAYYGSMNNQLNDNEDTQKGTSGLNSAAITSFNNYKMSDGIITDGSYIKLKNVQLAKMFALKNYPDYSFTLFMQSQNLFTITKYRGMDPEGVGGYLPALRTIAFGFILNF